MAFHRYLIEIGQGVDMHGEDISGAALKAVKDATHHCCMAGVHDIFQLAPSKESIRVQADIYVPVPGQVDPQPIRDYLGLYDTDVRLHTGGAFTPGLSLPMMGEGSHITIALAILTVYLNIEHQGGYHHE